MPKAKNNSANPKSAPGDEEAGDQQAKTCKSVEQLPDEQRQTLRQMLVEGATIEDAEEAVREMGGPQISARAIERYYRRDLTLQQDRIRHQLETARKLREALADSNSDHGDLAEAVLITGLMGVNRGSVSARAHQAFRIKGQQENVVLKQEAFRLQIKKFALDRKILEARLKTEVTKRELLASKLEQLQSAVEREGREHTIGPEIMRQIQEIYGLASAGEAEKENAADGHAKG
ncbi:MAG: phage protein Gp27 family protein [Terriglobia bacterium]